MPKDVPTEELDRILQFITESSERGVSLAELVAEFSMTPKKVRGRLQNLRDQELVRREGTFKDSRYYPKSIITPLSPPLQEDGGSTEIQPTTQEALEAIATVDLPIHLRTPVGYQPDFLNAYIPNESAYLSDSVKARLHAVGKVGFSEAPAGTYVRSILDRLLIDLSWNSSRLEGNTYSLLETENLIALGQAAEGKDDRETQMILNHKEVIELLADQALDIGFNAFTIQNVHAILSHNLLPDANACGALRVRPVGIGKSVYLPLAVPQQVEEYFLGILAKAEQIKDPFEQSFFIMVHLPYLQPFVDVNKRVSRLVANIPLIKKNLCPLSFIDVPQDDYVRGLLAIYELNSVDYMRDVFVWAYERSALRYSSIRESLGDPDPFRLRYRSEIKSYIKNSVQQLLTLEQLYAKIHMDSALSLEIREDFYTSICQDLKSLHNGNILRYGLRPSELAAWQQKQG